jgi:membrane associated rhomboid family serine protease
MRTVPSTQPVLTGSESFAQRQIPREQFEHKYYQGEEISPRNSMRNRHFQRSERISTPFIYHSGKMDATYAVMILNVIFFILDLFLYPYIRLNIITLTRGLFLHTILTSMFIPDGIISLIFSLLVFYSFGRTIEPNYGPKFFMTAYLLMGFFTAGTILLIQSLGLVIPAAAFLASNSAYLVASGGVFVGIIALFTFIMGPETRLTFLFFFIPVSLKSKYILIIIVSINMIFGLISLVIGDYSAAASLGSLGAIPAARILYKVIGNRMTQRWH